MTIAYFYQVIDAHGRAYTVAEINNQFYVVGNTHNGGSSISIFPNSSDRMNDFVISRAPLSRQEVIKVGRRWEVV